jgi:hypothetical protein
MVWSRTARIDRAVGTGKLARLSLEGAPSSRKSARDATLRLLGVTKSDTSLSLDVFFSVDGAESALAGSLHLVGERVVDGDATHARFHSIDLVLDASDALEDFEGARELEIAIELVDASGDPIADATVQVGAVSLEIDES